MDFLAECYCSRVVGSIDTVLIVRLCVYMCEGVCVCVRVCVCVCVCV